jgi:two-component system alkaline phosphatase synthesis response regulator PhoP
MERGSNPGGPTLDLLEQEGFEVRTLSHAPDVIQRIKLIRPCTIIIETRAPGSAVRDLCRAIRRLRSLSGTPVVLLAANASEEERVLGLESGADDYITESSSGRELLARVRAAMRRSARHELDADMRQVRRPFSPDASVAVSASAIKVGDIEINAAAMTISVRGCELVMTNLEYRLLLFLSQNQGRVFTRDQLLDAVWGPEFVELRSVDACIRRLRRKIEPQPLSPTYLKTVRGAGYRLQGNAA